MNSAEHIVVGGGLSGLAAARTLVDGGATVRVLEAGAGVGGRTRTDWIDGRAVDHGFQILFRGYREVLGLIRGTGLPPADLGALAASVGVWSGGKWLQYSAVPPRLPGVSAGDRAELVRLAVMARVRSPDSFLADEELGQVTTEQYLRERRGLSRGTIDALFRPLFGGIFLDRTLGADAGYFGYLASVMARGPALLPRDGLGQIGEWVAAGLRRDGVQIEHGAPVANVEVPTEGPASGVRLRDGRFLPAAGVVIAVDGTSARELVGAFDSRSAAGLPTEWSGMVSASFVLRRPLYRGRVVLLNGDAERDGVDLVCQTTNVTRPDAGPGEHILHATCVTTGRDIDPEALPAAVGRLVARWSPHYPWSREAELIRIAQHPRAQFRPLPGVRGRLPGPRTRLANVVLAGDCTTHPSLEGAVWAGRRAASTLLADQPLDRAKE